MLIGVVSNLAARQQLGQQASGIPGVLPIAVVVLLLMGKLRVANSLRPFDFGGAAFEVQRRFIIYRESNHVTEP